MEQIETIITNALSEQERKQSPNSLTKANKIQALVTLMQKFNPDAQNNICRDVDDCFFGSYPTLGDLARLYVNRAPAAWLVEQITDLVAFTNSSNQLNTPQIKSLAMLIAQQYFYLKLSELMLFFYWFKGGRYGRFYGAIDPMIITSALREFITDRGDYITYHEFEVRKRREEEEKRNVKNISYSDWQIIKPIAAMYNSEITVNN